MNERWNFLTAKFRSICFGKENGTIKYPLTDKIIEKKEKEKKSFMEDVNGNGKNSIGDRSIALDSISPISENKRFMDFMYTSYR